MTDPATLPEFVEFKSIPRLSRPCIITEKIDGTNGVVYVGEDGTVIAGSRSRWITPQMDNHGFAKWVQEHADELREGLGVGTHYGEWWGAGINKRYPGLPKRFSLFNVSRWSETRPACCDVVPVLYEGPFTTDAVEHALTALAIHGSRVAPGCKAEGVVVFHMQSRVMFKKTIEKDEEHKFQRSASLRDEITTALATASGASDDALYIVVNGEGEDKYNDSGWTDESGAVARAEELSRVFGKWRAPGGGFAHRWREDCCLRNNCTCVADGASIERFTLSAPRRERTPPRRVTPTDPRDASAPNGHQYPAPPGQFRGAWRPASLSRAKGW